MIRLAPGVAARAIRRPSDPHPYAVLLRVEGAAGSVAHTVLSRPEAERLIADLTALLTETPVEASLLTGGRA